MTMTKRKTVAPTATLTDGWTISDRTVVNGRHVSIGTQVSVTGERGRFEFVRHVVNGDHEWLDVRDRDARWRSFSPDRIRRVHYKRKGETRTSANR